MQIFYTLLIFLSIEKTFSGQVSSLISRYKRQESCWENQFKCTSGQCINKLAVCNGMQECEDGSDETISQCANKSGGCYLPDFPVGGTYAVLSCNVQGRCNGGPGALVPLNSLIKYECNNGYVLSSNSPVQFCGNNGFWSPEPPNCKKQCNPIRSDSLTIHCSYQGDEVRCDRPLNPGTKIRPRCKKGYKSDNTTESYGETKCLDDGTLERPLFRCVPDCGKRYIIQLIVGGSVLEAGEYPWHAGLYRRNKDKEFEYICGGTVISQYAILTAAHCVHDGRVMNPNDLKIAVAKTTRTWAIQDPYEMRYDVRQIIPHRQYRGSLTNYANDIAIIVLAKTIEIKELVLPACLDWVGEKKFVLGENGVVVGWDVYEQGEYSPKLMESHLTYYDFDSCTREKDPSFERFLTNDKFCAGYKKGDSVGPNMSGGGLTFVMNRLFYIYGVLSLKQKTDTSFAVFTNVTKHIDWIRTVFQALETENDSEYKQATEKIVEGCYLPDFPVGGTYAVLNCNVQGECNGGPGALVPLNSFIKYECNNGYVLSSNSPVQFCGNNNIWVPQPPNCKKQCNPIRSHSMLIECYYLGEEVRCDQPLNPGTKIRLIRCKQPYRRDHTTEPYRETKCLDDGTLERPLFKCVADCGIRYNNVAEPTIVNGSNTAVGEYPWHAGLYRRNKEEEFEYICGGTIIHQHAILTAAHCVYRDGIGIINPNDLKIALGKYSRLWTINDTHETRYDVKEIITEAEYRGQSNTYEQDIAIIHLAKTIEFTVMILPACLDWEEKKKFVLGENGTVVGWGLNENEEYSPTLMVAQLPYYDFESCRLETDPNFKRFITYDKFCAGYKSGIGVAVGDSGGGLTFVVDRKYYVYGIVSLRQKTGGASLTVFTNVTKHMDWVGKVLDTLSKSKKIIL